MTTHEPTPNNTPLEPNYEEELSLVVATARAAAIERVAHVDIGRIEEQATVEFAERAAVQRWVCEAEDPEVRIDRFAVATPVVISRYRDRTVRGHALDYDHSQATFSQYFKNYMSPFDTAEEPHQLRCAQSVVDFIAADIGQKNASALSAVMENPLPLKILIAEGVATRKLVLPSYLVSFLGHGDINTELASYRGLQILEKGPGTEKTVDAILRMASSAVEWAAPNLREILSKKRKTVTRAGAEFSPFTTSDMDYLAEYIKNGLIDDLTQTFNKESEDSQSSKETNISRLRQMNFRSVSSFGAAFRLIAYGLENGLFPSDPNSPQGYAEHGDLINLYIDAISLLSIYMLDAKSRGQAKTIGDFVMQCLDKGLTPQVIADSVNRRA